MLIYCCCIILFNVCGDYSSPPSGVSVGGVVGSMALFTSSFRTYSCRPSLVLDCSLRKLGKKKSLSTPKRISSLMILSIQRGLPHVILLSPSFHSCISFGKKPFLRGTKLSPLVACSLLLSTISFTVGLLFLYLMVMNSCAKL